MYNYTKYFIDKIKGFVLTDEILNSIIPQDNIYQMNKNKIAVFPSVVVQTIENSPESFSFSREAITNAGIQININCMDMIIDNELQDGGESCDYIASKIADYMENTLRFERITQTDPIPTDMENQIFTSYIRYRVTHDLLNNTISK